MVKAHVEQAGHLGREHGGQQQFQGYGAPGRHFNHDKGRGQRRARYPGQNGRHAHGQNFRPPRRIGQSREPGSHARPHGQRRGEYAARKTAERGGEKADELQRHIQPGNLLLAVQQLEGKLRAAAENGRAQAGRGHNQGAEQHKDVRALLLQPENGFWQPAVRSDGQPGKRPAGQTAAHGHGSDERQQKKRLRTACDLAEKGGIPAEAIGGRAREHHGQHQFARSAPFHGMGQFLKGEHQPGQGGVEGGRYAGRSAGENKLPPRDGVVARLETAGRVKHARAHLHGGAFKAEHKARTQPGYDGQKLGRGQARAQQHARAFGRIRNAQGGHGLLDAAALGARPHPAHGPGNGQPAGRQGKKRPPPPAPAQPFEQAETPGRTQAEQNGRKADARRRDPYQRDGSAAFPGRGAD